MYKAIRVDNEEAVIILAARWRDAQSQLEGWGRKDNLVCQECAQPVRPRMGPKRRWHFAHKHRKNCPVTHESPELLKARAVLYDWLSSKFGEENVDLEVKLDEQLPRAVDCLVRHKDKAFAYWIFDKAIAPKSREPLKEYFKNEQTPILNGIFLIDMLTADENDSSSVALTTTERKFMSESKYDVLYGSRVGKSLSYLNAEGQAVTTYRGLQIEHEPQQYKGVPRTTSLSEIQIAPQTGELVHPKEHENLKEHEKAERERKAQEAEEERRRKKREEEWHKNRKEQEKQREERLQQMNKNVRIPVKPTARTLPTPLSRGARMCIHCGEKTSDWWHTIGREECECRACFKKGITRK